MKSLRRSSMSSATVASKLSADNLNSVRSSMSASSRSTTPRARASPTAAQAAAAAELPFNVGDYVTIINTEFSGVVRFVGPVHFSMGTWVGVELATPTGKNDGSVQGKRFFTCRPSHGLFVKAIVCAKSDPIDDIAGPFSEGEREVGGHDYHAAAQASASATASAGRTPAKATTPTARRRATVGPASSSSSSSSSSGPRSLSAAGMTYGGSSAKPKQRRQQQEQQAPPSQQPQQPRTISSQRATVLNALDSTIKGTVPTSSHGDAGSDRIGGRGARQQSHQQQEHGNDSDGYSEYETDGDGGEGGYSSGRPESPASSLGSRDATPAFRKRKGAGGGSSDHGGEGGDTTVLQQSFDSLTLQVMSLDGRLMALEGVMASLVTSIGNVEQSVDKVALQHAAAATPAPTGGDKGGVAGEDGAATAATVEKKAEEIASLKAALRQASELAKQVVVIVLNKGPKGQGNESGTGAVGGEISGSVLGSASPTPAAAEAASTSSSPARGAPDAPRLQQPEQEKGSAGAESVAAPVSPSAVKVAAQEGAGAGAVSSGAPTPTSRSSSVAAMMFGSVTAAEPADDAGFAATVAAASVSASATATAGAGASATSMATIKDNADLSVSRVLPDTANAVDSDDESDLDLSRSSIIAAGGVAGSGAAGGCGVLCRPGVFWMV